MKGRPPRLLRLLNLYIKKVQARTSRCWENNCQRRAHLQVSPASSSHRLQVSRWPSMHPSRCCPEEHFTCACSFAVVTMTVWKGATTIAAFWRVDGFHNWLHCGNHNSSSHSVWRWRPQKLESFSAMWPSKRKVLQLVLRTFQVEVVAEMTPLCLKPRERKKCAKSIGWHAKSPKRLKINRWARSQGPQNSSKTPAQSFSEIFKADKECSVMTLESF